jgi:hypothetical protein
MVIGHFSVVIYRGENDLLISHRQMETDKWKLTNDK